ncbi:hypothetical protein SO694_0006003 [Aureococcus anophagefferens]|uniref:MYND-type domain-containing protein n=1 Tax=Aureococcus anophagefferens TaxID=44056 RepID=A0ABR1FQY3_AURAN
MSWREKKLEYETRMARAKGKKLDTLKTCTICGADKAKACQGCGTTAYCSTDCQRIDWRDRGHRKVCKKIQAAEAARAEAPTRAPSPPVFYGPAPRSHADEVRARIAAEHEAAQTDAEQLACLRRHVENEVPEAIRFLGLAYRRSWMGIVKSDKKAAKIYRRAVELGDVGAMTLLGKMYEKGLGVKLDKKKAERLIRDAADRGDAYWFERAAAKGFEDAIEALAGLDARA